MKFFKDSAGFTEEEVDRIMQATNDVRQKIVKHAYSDIMRDKIFIKGLIQEDGEFLVRSKDRSIFLFVIGSETVRGSDSRDRYLLYYQDNYYFLSTGYPELFIYGTEEKEEYYVPGYEELVPAHLLKYTEEALQKIRERNQYYDQDDKLITPVGISFYVDTPINPADKQYLQSLLREMLVMIHSHSWSNKKYLTEYERAYIEDISDYGVNTVSFSR